jgi:hypothetical protein
LERWEAFALGPRETKDPKNSKNEVVAPKEEEDYTFFYKAHHHLNIQ